MQVKPPQSCGANRRAACLFSCLALSYLVQAESRWGSVVKWSWLWIWQGLEVACFFFAVLAMLHHKLHPQASRRRGKEALGNMIDPPVPYRCVTHNTTCTRHPRLRLKLQLPIPRGAGAGLVALPPPPPCCGDTTGAQAHVGRPRGQLQRIPAHPSLAQRPQHGHGENARRQRCLKDILQSILSFPLQRMESWLGNPKAPLETQPAVDCW